MKEYDWWHIRMADVCPNINTDEGALTTAGYTPMGVRRYVGTVQAYSQAVFDRAIAFSDIEKEDGLAREVTHEHVRAAASAVAHQPPGDKSTWSIAGQVGEYVMTAVAGAGAGHLDTTYGTLAFGIGTAIAILLFVTRKSKRV